MKATKLSNITVTMLSLVGKGANGADIIYKSASDDKPNIKNHSLEIIKTDKEKGIVYAVVYEPDKLDSDGDFTTADEIEKASYKFMESQLLNKVDKDHDMQVRDAHVVESFILKGTHPMYKNVKEGAWVVAIKVNDEKLKKSIKDGEIGGLSMYGTALKEEVSKSGDSKNEDILKAIKDGFSSLKDIFKKDNSNSNEGEEVNKEDIVKAIKEATEPLVQELKDVKKGYEEIKKENDELKRKISKSHQDGDPIQKSYVGGIL